jgi:hypothetical protein
MATITEYRNAIMDEWKSIVEDLDDNNVFKNVDDAIPMFTNDLYDTFMVVMYTGSGADGRRVFTEYRWSHNYISSYFVKFKPEEYDYEIKMEEFLELAKRFAYTDQRLNGIAQLAMPIAIDMPEVVNLNDIGFYVTAVTVQIWDKF